MLLRTKIGISVWISMVKVWHAAFTIATMTNHAKLTALDNSKSKLMIALVRLVGNGRFIKIFLNPRESECNKGSRVNMLSLRYSNLSLISDKLQRRMSL